MGGHSESKSNLHAGGTVSARVQKLLNLRESRYLVELLGDLATSHAEYCSVEEDVFATGEFRMKADPHFQKSTNAAAEHDPAFGRLSNTAEDLEKRTLAAPLRPSDG
jgi:hypothetical protein